MAVAEKVIFAEDTATVHVLIGDVEEYPDGTKHEPHESRVLLAGQTVNFSEVPSYLQELVKKGEAPNLILLTAAQAKKLQSKQAAMKAVSLRDFIEDEDDDIEE